MLFNQKLICKYLFAVCNVMNNKQIVPQDEDLVNQLLRIFDIAQLENNEAFVAHTYQLKELRFRMGALKMKFPQKNHYHKNGGASNNGNSNKARYFQVFFRF